jgi:membrane protease YdiL (CAAX protease family)
MLSQQMKKHSLLAYFLILLVVCAAIVAGARALGRQGAYLAQIYMLGPAIAALVTRLLFHPSRFRDANLRLGRLVDYVKYWLVSLAIVAMYFVVYTSLGAVEWDLSGRIFLERLSGQFVAAGQDMQSSLPSGFTPRGMLFLYFVGGLTFFNVFPGLIAGFGEEFGHRGFMFTGLYRIGPWFAIVGGGLLWFAWHLPLLLLIPQVQPATPIWQGILNGIVLVVGSVCTHAYLAYVYIRSRSIFVASIAHITMNNASMATGYFVVMQDQLLANVGTALVMIGVIVAVYAGGGFRVFRDYFSVSPPATE